jgi:putative FmdB family regulatory protein
MPMFEYVCRACGERFEELRSADPADPRPVCPECGSEEVVKLFSSFATSSSNPVRGGGGGASSCGGSRRFT